MRFTIKVKLALSFTLILGPKPLVAKTSRGGFSFEMEKPEDEGSDPDFRRAG